ncbi:HNH endonuclease [Testudinibacter sp. TR-2022]|uniref:HNH endonuclease n=1 Tax=Testudinibacter sp. TR-2022 TaxID=2585029 RepID=UPI00111825D9|nr:HNH endonuclease [Testudinibacter sp. TR-2022]TNH02448.1 hypothetical protein FHQ30_13125 [Pasteurellaceae bacterium Phil11]TNH19414.1 hypothetical protein FHQ29_12645 [Testudinibacter sp. TR-2022]
MQSSAPERKWFEVDINYTGTKSSGKKRLYYLDFRSVSYEEQMKLATQDLAKAIDKGNVDKNQFTSKQLEAIYKGDNKIPNLTWHHHQDTGRMQLVPELIHSKTGHIGGNSIQKGK